MPDQTTTPAEVIARLTDPNGDDPCSTAEPVTLPGIADLHQERGEHKSAAAIRQAIEILTARQRFYAVQLGDDDGWVVMRDDPINGTPVWRFNEFPPGPSRGEDAHRLTELLNAAAGFVVRPLPDEEQRREVEELACRLAVGTPVAEHNFLVQYGPEGADEWVVQLDHDMKAAAAFLTEGPTP